MIYVQQQKRRRSETCIPAAVSDDRWEFLWSPPVSSETARKVTIRSRALEIIMRAIHGEYNDDIYIFHKQWGYRHFQMNGEMKDTYVLKRYGPAFSLRYTRQVYIQLTEMMMKRQNL